MTTLLFGVLAAASLAAGVDTPPETRSAQALPTQHLAVATVHPAAPANVRVVNRLADSGTDSPASDSLDKERCERHLRHWDAKRSKCLISWPVPLIGAATVAGVVYAITSSEGSGNQGAVSH